MKILKPVYLAACVGGLAFTTKAAGGDIEPKMLQAYSGGQYELAKKLSAQCKDSSKAKLMSALCDVYNMKNQDLSHGLQGLKRLYEDGKVTGKIRIQAGLSYARAAQTLSMRDGLYDEVEDIDYEAIYLDIIKTYPDSLSSVLAVMYLTQKWFELDEGKKAADAFVLINKFMGSLKGGKRLLVPLHFMLADQYVIYGGRYALAVKELEYAVGTGLSNPRVGEDAAYRIARIYDVRLHDREKALMWYRKFIKDYSGSSKAVLARRYIKELISGSKR